MLALDQITKSVVAVRLKVAESIPVIDGVFHITLVLNKGVAFGLLRGYPGIPVAIASVAIVVILYFLIRYSSKTIFSVKLGLCFILAGCMGNLIDRFRFGVVIDFLDFRIWPVFNLADSAISSGVALLIVSFLAKKPFLKRVV